MPIPTKRPMKIRAHELRIRHVLYTGFAALLVIVGLSIWFYQNTLRVISSDFERLYALQHTSTGLADVTAGVASLHASAGMFASFPTKQRQEEVAGDLLMLNARLQSLRQNASDEPTQQLIDQLASRLNEMDQSFLRYVIARRRASGPGVKNPVLPSTQGYRQRRERGRGGGGRDPGGGIHPDRLDRRPPEANPDDQRNQQPHRHAGGDPAGRELRGGDRAADGPAALCTDARDGAAGRRPAQRGGSLHQAGATRSARWRVRRPSSRRPWPSWARRATLRRTPHGSRRISSR